MSTAPAATSKTGKGRLRNGVVLGGASVAIGLMTTFSGVIIELASGMLADLRHGICVVRPSGDTRPMWEAMVAGGLRPYDRTRCCGGAASVDHSTGECRASSIIQHSSRKRLALPARAQVPFGHVLENASQLSFSEVSSNRVQGNEADIGVASVTSRQTHSRLRFREGRNAVARSSVERGEITGQSVGADATRVRTHMSHLFGPDSGEKWAEEAITLRRYAHQSLTEQGAEVAVNEGVAQTQTQSAGNVAPVYEWVPWERALLTKSGPLAPVFIYVAGTGLLGFLAAVVTRCQPHARGSGIPEVKANVAGFALPKTFEVRTLVAKVVALSLCVGAGLAVGKEGPMIHIGACCGTLLAALIAKFAQDITPATVNETDLVCIGAAAGVSAAFGAPLAGVLFAVEELGTTLPTGLRYSTMICALVSAVVAALALKGLDLTRTQRLTLFEVDYKQPWAPWEAVPFCLLGVFGGALGGAFVLANEAVHKRRIKAESSNGSFWFLPENCSRIVGRLLYSIGADARTMEVVLLAIFTSLSNYPHMLTRMFQNDGIKALFSQCDSTPRNDALHDRVGLCSVHDLFALSGFLHLLFGAACLRFMQAVVTFGALTPAGLFVPSLYVGGCVGRALGGLLRFAGLGGTQGLVEPGIYAMVGAGAMLAGVSRLTVSLAVVLFELTGGLTYVVPFMLAVLTAKWTGDMVTAGKSVYDVHAELKGLTKVETTEDVRILNATLADLPSSSPIRYTRSDPSKAFNNANVTVPVRPDCPLQTAYCIFRNRSEVSSLTTTDLTSGEQILVSRETFMSHLAANYIIRSSPRRPGNKDCAKTCARRMNSDDAKSTSENA